MLTEATSDSQTSCDEALHAVTLQMYVRASLQRFLENPQPGRYQVCLPFFCSLWALCPTTHLVHLTSKPPTPPPPHVPTRLCGSHNSPVRISSALLLTGLMHAGVGQPGCPVSCATVALMGLSCWLLACPEPLSKLFATDRLPRHLHVCVCAATHQAGWLFLSLRLSRHYLPPVAASGEKDES